MKPAAATIARRGVAALPRAALTLVLLARASAAWAGPPAGAPARARLIGIVIAGPASARGPMLEAVEAALGADAHVSWSERDALLDGEPWRVAGASASTEIWIDVTDPVRVRISVPAGEGAASGALVRTVDTPAAGADGSSQPVARETVAQIVRSAVQILSEGEVEEARPVGSAPPPEGLMVPRPPDVDVSERPGPPAPRVQDSPSVTARGRLGVAIGAGAHTSPFLLAEPHTESHWLGISLQLAARWESPKVLLALRASWEPSERTVDNIDLKSQLCSLGLAVSRKVTFGEFTLSLGGELGGLFLRQETSVIFDPYNTGTNPYAASLNLPGQLGTTWSSGVLFGPVAELSVAVSEHAFIHIGVARPIAFMNVADNGDESWHASGYWRLVGGLGASL